MSWEEEGRDGKERDYVGGSKEENGNKEGRTVTIIP